MTPKKILIYTTNHGFGHISRICVLISKLLKTIPDIQIYLKTNIPEWFIYSKIPVPINIIKTSIDIGLIQHDSLNIDFNETIKQNLNIIKNSNKIIETEIITNNKINPDIIISDIPALTFNIANKMAIPSIGISNFSWDWIYEKYTDEYPIFKDIIAFYREAYHLCDVFFQLPFSGDMTDTFNNIIHTPLIGSVSKKNPEEIKQILNIPNDKIIILLSFGGFSFNADSFKHVNNNQDYLFISSEQIKHIDNFFNIPNQTLKNMNLTYTDLINVADIVITKLGYGITAETILNKSKVLYTDRGNFREFKYLESGIKKYLPSLFIPQQDLFNKNLFKYIDKLNKKTNNFKTINSNGADFIINYIFIPNRFQ